MLRPWFMVPAVLLAAACTPGSVEDRLATLETLAAEQAAQSDALAADLAAFDARLAALEQAVTVLTDEGITDLQTAVAALRVDHDALAQVVLDEAARTDALGATTGALAVDVDINRERIDGLDAAVAANIAEISRTNSRLGTAETDITNLSTRVTTAEGSLTSIGSRVTTAEATLVSHGSRLGTCESRIDEAELDIVDLLSDVQDLDGALDESLAGLFPALFEFQPRFTEGSYESGRSGLLLQTSGGAFNLGGYISASGMSSERTYFTTFYVENPTDSNISVTMTYCGGDDNRITVNGTTVRTPPDRDGRCGAEAAFNIPPGKAVVRFRQFDSNNVFEGMGVLNPWIADTDLEVDWETLRERLSEGLE